MKIYNHTCRTSPVLLDEIGTSLPVYFDASFDHGTSHVQSGDPCPICGDPLTMESLRPLAMPIDVDDTAVHLWETTHSPEAFAEQQSTYTQGNYWTLQMDGQLNIYNRNPAHGGRLLAVLLPEATQRLGAFLADRMPAF
jgi:hypothetical protein